MEAWLDLVRKRKREKLGTKVRGKMTPTVRDARERERNSNGERERYERKCLRERERERERERCE